VVEALLFVGSSLDDVRAFPIEGRREAAFELDAVQRGLEPRDWKPFPNAGSGVKEIRIHVRGEWRVLYVASFAEAVYVLHCFHKKRQRTRRYDVELARQRYNLIGGRK
jgi:phage-related protein